MDLTEFVATAEAPEEVPEHSPGWSDLGGMARKFHYFPDNVGGTLALCGKWGIMRTHKLQPETGTKTPDDCVACTRRLRGKEA
jgi:hypothetical protein